MATKSLLHSQQEGKPIDGVDPEKEGDHQIWRAESAIPVLLVDDYLDGLHHTACMVAAGGFLRPSLGFLLVPSILAGLYAGVATESFLSALLLCLSTSFVALAVRGGIGLLMLVPSLIADDMYLASKVAGEQLTETLMIPFTVLPLLLLGAIPTAVVRELHGDTLKKTYLATLARGNRDPPIE